MGQYLNPGNEGFTSAVNSEIYVDKTGLLEYTNRLIGTEQRWLCVSRPRRFGKSIAARMVSAYYSKGCDSEKLFEGLKILREGSFSTHLNKHNVIQLDIAELSLTTPLNTDVVSWLQQCVICELRDAFPKYVPEEAVSLPVILADINAKTGERFIFVIDEWDAIFRDDKNNTRLQDAYIDLLRGLFKGEKSLRFVNLAYMTGILPVKRYNSESALNNFREYTMTSPKGLAEYVGLTEEEVKNLCGQYAMDFTEMQRWYDGYSFLQVQHVYCPNSVVNAAFDREFHSYWSKTVAFESLKLYITMDYKGLKKAIILLLAGERCKVNVNKFENDMISFRSRDDVLTLLIHLGYLGYDPSTKEAYVPNAEVRDAFAQAIEDTDWESTVEAMQKSDELLRATIGEDAQRVAAGIEEAHMRHSSILEYNDENSLRCVIKLAYFSAINYYVDFDEMPGGVGRADVVFMPRRGVDRPLLVIELKYNKSAEGAISQIKKRNYPDRLKEYGGKMLLVGINYDKEDKDKKHSCIIEEWEK